jgi:alpha-beta hydrolase superfamily lysophospholipase
VPGLQILVLPNGVLDYLIEGGDFRFQPGDHPGHGGVGRRGVLARAAPHSTRDTFSASRQIAQLAQGG